MHELEALKEKLTSAQSLRWDQLPGIGLYMDQVLTLLKQMMMDDGPALTAAMVNNYTKAGLLPRPEKKKYSREHVARLMAISVFKQVLSVKDTQTLIEQYHNELHQPDAIYNRFLDMLDKTLVEASGRIETNATKTELRRFAVDLALTAYSQKLICETIIQALASLQATPDA